MTPEELFGAERCELCGESFKLSDEVGEMYSPTAEPAMQLSFIVHAECGLARGMEVA